ncbi:MAG: adenosylcobinamide-GDP ribazoletransferase [Halanaerobiales bacterium]
MNSFLIALQFITTIPVKKELKYSEKEIAHSMIYYPLVGSILGLVLVLINLIGSKLLPDLVSSSLLLMFFVLLSGGIHLDGLADSFDGFLGGKNKKEILSIMRDSSIGVYGVLAVFLILIFKFTLLIELPIARKNMILIIVPTISRWAMVLAVYLFPYARKEGFGKAYKLYLKKKHVLAATVWVLLLTLILFFWKGALVLGVSFLIIWLIGEFITRKIDGLTGDNYGAINEIMEVAVLLLMILFY